MDERAATRVQQKSKLRSKCTYSVVWSKEYLCRSQLWLFVHITAGDGKWIAVDYSTPKLNRKVSIVNYHNQALATRCFIMPLVKFSLIFALYKRAPYFISRIKWALLHGLNILWARAHPFWRSQSRKISESQVPRWKLGAPCGPTNFLMTNFKN